MPSLKLVKCFRLLMKGSDQIIWFKYKVYGSGNAQTFVLMSE